MAGSIHSDLLNALSVAAAEFFDRSAKQNFHHTASLKLGPFSVRLSCQTEPLYAVLVPQFGLVAQKSEATPDLVVRVMQDAESLAHLQKCWSAFGLPEPYTSTTVRHGDLRIHAEFDEQGLAILFVLDIAIGAAVYAAAAAERVRKIEGAYPLLLLLRLWSERTPYLWTHGAVVGAGKAGVLITGIGGAGKSSTSLSVTGGKLKLIGDDHVFIGPDRIAHSIYCTIRVREDMLPRIEALDPWFGKQWFYWRDKPSQILPADKHHFFARQAPLKAIVLLRHHCDDALTFHPLPRIAGLRAITPVTVTRYYSDPMATLEKLIGIVAPLPVYEFRTSPDLSTMRDPFERFVRTLEG